MHSEGGGGGGGREGRALSRSGHCFNVTLSGNASCKLCKLHVWSAATFGLQEGGRERDSSRDTDDEVDDDVAPIVAVVAGKHANYVASLAAAAPIVPVEWRPCLCVQQQHGEADKNRLINLSTWNRKNFALYSNRVRCVECANFLVGRRGTKQYKAAERKKVIKRGNRVEQ